MSVLYKALARAAKARDGAKAGEGYIPEAAASQSPPRRRWRRLIVLFTLVAALLLLFVFLAEDMLFGPSAPPSPPHPTIARQAPRARPVPPAIPAKPAGDTAAAAKGAQTAAGTATPANPVPAVSAPATPAQTPQTPTAAAAAAAAAIQAPAAAAAQPPPHEGAPAISAEQDLPAVLDRIRRQQLAQTVKSGVVVDRGTPAAVPLGANQPPLVSVSESAARGRDDVDRAYDLLMRGQYAGALEAYRAVLKTDPRNLPALLGTATALHKLRRYADAHDAYRRVLALDPQNRQALTNMTAIIAARAPDHALAELARLQRSYPSFSPIAAEIGEIAAQRGDLPAAVAQMRRAVALSPENGLYRLNLAIIEDRMGDAREAAASYRAALELLGDETNLPLPIDQVRARLRYLQSR